MQRGNVEDRDVYRGRASIWYKFKPKQLVKDSNKIPEHQATSSHQISLSRDPEVILGVLLLSAALCIGLFTVADYGITTDEFVFDPSGPKALAWYTSGFKDRSLFSYYDSYLYGPWFQILVAAAQSAHLADPFVVRHTLSFVVGLSGIATLLPLGRLAVGRYAGLIAVVLCLTTGTLYGHLFFTPYDIPFLAAMCWATLAIVIMARNAVPTWGTTIVAGLLTGLAISTRFGGLLSQAYLVGAMILCSLEIIGSRTNARAAALTAIATRTCTALLIGWLTAIATWPWLQSTDPIGRFLEAYNYFIRSYVQFKFVAWGQTISSAALPWHYIPGQFLARLPEGFIALLVIAALFGSVALARFCRGCWAKIQKHGFSGALVCLRELSQSRALLTVAAAALCPPIFIVIKNSVIFDGIRHLLFIIPMLALLAAWALLQLFPLFFRMPVYAFAATALHLISTIGTMIYLHPLEYIAMNSLSGGVPGAYRRFDLDYWSAAATEAVRRLETQLAHDPQERFAAREPVVKVCIGWRELMVGPMFRRPWTVTKDAEEADFIIETERSPCGRSVQGTVIDRVKRFGETFATTIERP